MQAHSFSLQFLLNCRTLDASLGPQLESLKDVILWHKDGQRKVCFDSWRGCMLWRTNLMESTGFPE